MKHLLVLFSFFVSSSFLKAETLQFFTHNLKGQTYINKDGELRGKEHAGKRAFNVELVRKMMIRLGYPTKMKEVPFKRGFLDVQQQDNRALFNVSRTPAREKLVKWVGPLQVERDYFYEMKKRATGAKTLNDAKKVKSICVMNGGVHESTLKKHGFTNYTTNTSYVNCFKMLKLGRVNLTPSATSTVNSKITEAGINPKEIIQTPVLLIESGGYLAFSKNVPQATIQKWQAALDSIKSSGEYKMLYEKYHLPPPK